jgi:hypothetical protein
MKQKLSQSGAMHELIFHAKQPTSSVDKAESRAWLTAGCWMKANLSSSRRQFLTLKPNSKAINVGQEEMEDEIFCF